MASSNVYPIDIAGTVRKPVNEPDQGGADIIVFADGQSPTFDPNTNTTQVDLPDGTVEISVGPPEPEKKSSEDFNENLAELLSESELSTIAEKLLMGIDQDIQSRSAWMENMSNGISLLGLELKNPRGAAASGATPQEGVSTVDHPLLLEAVLRFQANARGELLPSDGPVKVRNDGEGNTLADKLAKALEKDLNHYLIKVAKEYYPDTDRMLLLLGFSGISFKKGSHHPIKRRPVIESIDAQDLIVSNAATDIDGAGRVTHRIMMRPSVLKRMQLVDAYRNIYLSSPGTPEVKNPVDAKIDQIQGIAAPSYIEPDDHDRELYECYCEIEVPGFEHRIDGKLTGLPLPYKVTIDKESRKILEVRRNWAEDDFFCMPINRIIAYTFIPGLGFYGIGLLNILGNSTKAMSAAWRLMIDAGMFSNFPGFLYLKSMAKQLTNQFRIPPGGGQAIDTVGGNIRDAIMPLPYKDPSPVFIQLMDAIGQAAQRVGGTAELQIGEGKQDAPVGTTLAMIEQATKLMSAVHKRLHQAQGSEFSMLKDLLMEDPGALWRHNKKSKVLQALTIEVGQQPIVDEEEDAEARHRELFLAALNDCELIPAADPNTSSQTERYLKVVAMRQMAATNQNLDMNKIDEYALGVIGIDDPEEFFKTPPAPGSQAPDPQMMAAQATLVAAQARLADSQTKAAEAQVKARTDSMSMEQEAQIKQAEMAAKERIASLGVSRELVIHQADTIKEQQERDHAATQADMDRQHELRLAQMGHQADASQAQADRSHDALQANLGNAHEAQQTQIGLAHEARQNRQGLAHEALQGALGRRHEIGLDQTAKQHEAGGRVQDAGLEVANMNHEAGLEAANRSHEANLDTANRNHEITKTLIDKRHDANQNELDRKHALELKKHEKKPESKPK